jgi:hypothetical protein
MSSVAFKIELSFTENEFSKVALDAGKSGMSIPVWIRSCLEMAPIVEKKPSPVIEQDSTTQIEHKQKAKRKYTRHTTGNGPMGYDAIIKAAEKIAVGKSLILKQTKVIKPLGATYNKAMSRWYKENGFDKINTSMRSALSHIADRLEEIREWHRHLPSTYLSEKIGPAGVLYYYNNLQKKIPKASSVRIARPAPQLRKREEVKTTLLWRDGKLQTAPVDEVINPVIKNGEAIATVDVAIKQKIYPDFVAVGEFDELDAYDKRVLKLFTKRLTTHERGGGGISETIAQRDIAAVLRKIRNSQESGNNSPSAEALVRLGVLWGKSGDYRLRKEYIERFPYVRRWAES